MGKLSVIVAVDVHYAEVSAVAAAVCFRGWNEREIVQAVKVRIDGVADYKPGLFFERELPCLVEVIRKVDLPIKAIVIDGYVFLGEACRPGLGCRLWEFLGRNIPIVGVAKTKFHETPVAAQLFRGGSTRALYVTSVGMDLSTAKECVLSMHGKYRIPDLLKKVDQLSRSEI